jgi:hypothetical protein
MHNSEATDPLLLLLSPYMDNFEKMTASETQFWKGVLMGIMAGMVIVAWTYGIADRTRRDLREPEEAQSQPPAPKLVQRTVA